MICMVGQAQVASGNDNEWETLNVAKMGNTLNFIHRRHMCLVIHVWTCFVASLLFHEQFIPFLLLKKDCLVAIRLNAALVVGTKQKLHTRHSCFLIRRDVIFKRRESKKKKKKIIPHSAFFVLWMDGWPRLFHHHHHHTYPYCCICCRVA